jgi:hypothetical protein
VIKGWSDDVCTYKVYQSAYCQGRWVGRFLDAEGNTCNLLGVEQDDLFPSWDMETTDKATRELFLREVG